MSHFAEVDENNIVTRVIVVPDEQEHRGHDFACNDLGLGGRWIQTSYTSRGGKRIDPVSNEVTDESDHYRYNFAGIGYAWDENFGQDGAFIPPKPEGMASWVVDPMTAYWIPPVPMPLEGSWEWDEDTVSWIEIPENL